MVPTEGLKPFEPLPIPTCLNEAFSMQQTDANDSQIKCNVYINGDQVLISS